jgi:DNA adenine methylase
MYVEAGDPKAGRPNRNNQMSAVLKSTTPTRPVVRYHGGKWQLAPWIISHFPPHRIYVEPYSGAASVLLQKPRSCAEIYNDLEGDIVNLFRVLRDRKSASELERLLQLTPFAREEWESCYLQRTGVVKATAVERARCAIVRAYQGFGSASMNQRHLTGFRASSHRSGTTPSHDWANFPKAIARITERLQAVCIERRPALRVIEHHDSPETLFYLDPPYVTHTRGRVHREVYRHELSDRQHRNLGRALLEIQGMVVISGYASPIYDRELFPHWLRVEKHTNADGARTRTEVLWLNKKAEEGLSQLQLFRNSGGG